MEFVNWRLSERWWNCCILNLEKDGEFYYLEVGDCKWNWEGKDWEKDIGIGEYCKC